MRIETAFFTIHGDLIITDNVMTTVTREEMSRLKYLQRAIDKIGKNNLKEAHMALMVINGELNSSSVHFKLN